MWLDLGLNTVDMWSSYLFLFLLCRCGGNPSYSCRWQQSSWIWWQRYKKEGISLTEWSNELKVTTCLNHCTSSDCYVKKNVFLFCLSHSILFLFSFLSQSILCLFLKQLKLINIVLNYIKKLFSRKFVSTFTSTLCDSSNLKPIFFLKPVF